MKKLLFALLVLVGMTHAAITATFSKNLSAVDSAITMSAGSYNSVSFQLDSTWSATVKFEGTVSGTKWITVYAVNQKGGAVDSVATANGVYLLSGNGFKLIRARVSARSSGTIKVQAYANEGSGVVSLLNQSSAGASSNVAVTSSALPTGAATAANQTNGNQVTQLVDSAGSKIGSTTHALDVNIKSGASSGAVAQGSTTSGQTGGLTQAAVTTAAPTYTTGQTNPLSMTTTGALRVDASAQTLTVGSHAVTNAGTFATQAAQSGPWNITNISGTVSLPTGAATAAKQPALGTAGSSSADVLSVQGIASGTAMPVSATSFPLPTGASTEATLAAASAKLPATLGQKAMTASMAVVLASDQASVPVASTLQAGSAIVGKMGIDQTTPGTTNGVQITAALPAGTNTLGSVTAVGAAAHGASISGAPVRTGARARTSDISTVTNDQVVDQIATPDGKAVFMPYALRPSKWHYTPPAAGLTSTTPVKVKSGASGLRVCTTSLQVMSEHQTISTEVIVYASPGAGAATDTLWRGWGQAIGGGAALAMPVDVCTPNTGDSLKVVESTATGTAGVLVNLQGYTTAE